MIVTVTGRWRKETGIISKRNASTAFAHLLLTQLLFFHCKVHPKMELAKFLPTASVVTRVMQARLHILLIGFLVS